MKVRKLAMQSIVLEVSGLLLVLCSERLVELLFLIFVLVLSGFPCDQSF